MGLRKVESGTCRSQGLLTVESGKFRGEWLKSGEVYVELGISGEWKVQKFGLPALQGEGG